jgi:acetyl esterase/lipase
MITRFASALLLLAAAPAVFPQAGQNPPYRQPEGIEVRRDLVYSRIGSREIRLDLFLPKEGAGPFPAVVYIHGGGWVSGNRLAFQRHAAHMATKGFVGACIEYRLSGEAQYPAAVYDSKAAVRWLRANAKQYRIDPRRIGAAGGSAGGHLVAMLGTTAGIRRLEGNGGNPEQSSAVAAVAAFNPAVDLVGFGQGKGSGADNSIVKFLGKPYGEAPDLWAEATPITHVSKSSAPTLFLHGTGDTTVPYEQSLKMMKKLQAAGVRAEILPAEGAGHGFFNRPPHYQPCLERMEKFFTELLKK